MRVTRYVVRVVGAVTTVVAVMVGAAAVPTSSSKERAAVWAKGLSASELSAYTQPKALAGLPVDYRLAVFAALRGTDERIGFWQSVFASYRLEHALSPAQESTLQQAESMITVMFRALPSERKALEPKLSRVSLQVASVLGVAAQRELFTTAGPEGRDETLPVRERVVIGLRGWSRTNAVARVANRIPPALFAAGDCNCNHEQNDCYYSQHCTEDLNQCTHSGGCACDWLFFNCWTCDGVCNYANEG